MFDAGMTMARINLSHGTLKQKTKTIKKFAQAKRLRPHKTCALMIEFRGQEVRISELKEGPLTVKVGDQINIVENEQQIKSDVQNLRISTNKLVATLKPNDLVYLDDGNVIGIVAGMIDTGAILEIKVGGTIKSRCQVKPFD